MSDRGVVLAAAVAALAALFAPAVPVVVGLALVIVAVVVRRPVPAAVAVALLVGGRAHEAVVALDRPLPERVAGTAQLVGDPVPGRFGTRVDVRIDGRRWSADVDRADEWILRPLLSGDHVQLVGRPRPLRDVPRGWQLSEHLAGRLDVAEIGRGPPAAPWFALANGIHRRLADGAASLGPERRALYLGLVVGDDRAQGDLERYRFRATGLGHLLAVSGQNVAFLLAVASPLLDRSGPRGRWVLAAAVLAGFVLVTRAEPSVLRAAAMAAVAVTASSTGRIASGARVLSLALIGLLLVDPLLVHAMGFRLSVCATVGLLVGVRPLAARLPGPRWAAEAAATTLVAQLATAPILVAMNGGIPSVATAANVLAVPAAGLVMGLGMSVGIVAGSVAAPIAAVVMLPVRALVAWIDGVARLGSQVPLPLLGPARLALLAVAAVAVLAVRARTPTGRWVRRPLLALALAPALVALIPTAPGDGTWAPAPGSVLLVGECGRRLEVLGRDPDVLDVLTGLALLGVVRVDVVAGPAGASAAMAELAEQLRATVVVRPAAGSGSDPEAGEAGRAGPRGPSGALCTVRP